MPPHPRLWDKIKSGEIKVPKTFYKDDMGYLKLNKTTSETIRAIVLLAEFPDQPAQVSPEFFDSLLFLQRHFRNGNLWEYYKEVTYGKCIITTEDLPSQVGWLMMPQNYTYYTNGQYGLGSYPRNAQKLTEDAIAAADPYVDFSKYDNDGDGYVDALFVIHTGPGAEYTGDPDDIWSHAWVTHTALLVDGVICWRYSMEPEYYDTAGDVGVGVFAHEMGHSVFGLPDMYDYDYDSKGLGNWSLMASGSWLVGFGYCPAHPDIWCKIKMGVVNPISLCRNLFSVKLYPIEDTAVCYKMWKFGEQSSQYFLIVYRKRKGYDAYLPAGGVLVYHCDDAMSDNDNQWIEGESDTGALHYLCALEQADGKFDLEKNINAGDAGDRWPYFFTGKNIFSSFSMPSTKDYNYDYTFCRMVIRTFTDSMAILDLFVGKPLFISLPETLLFNESNLKDTLLITPAIIETLTIIDSVKCDSMWVSFIPVSCTLYPGDTLCLSISVDTTQTKRVSYAPIYLYHSFPYVSYSITWVKLRLKAPLLSIPCTLSIENIDTVSIKAKSVGEFDIICDSIKTGNLVDTIYPQAFILPPGDSTVIHVKIDTSSLDTGIYLIPITFYTNDAIANAKETIIKLKISPAFISEKYFGKWENISTICWRKIRIFSERNIKLQLFDITGRCLFDGLSKDLEKINLPSGIYFVRISGSNIKNKIILLK